jgi:hypothetical protein
MTNDKLNAEEVPEGLRPALMDGARKACRQQGVNPDTIPLEALESVAMLAWQRLKADVAARAKEITDEELKRSRHEELERLTQLRPENAVLRDELHGAVIARIIAEYGHLLAPRPGRRPTEE